jgi:hypothetical protein
MGKMGDKKRPKWQVRGGMHFEELSDNHFSLFHEPDEICVGFMVSEIDDIINTLERIKAHYENKEKAKEEIEKLAKWVECASGL